MNSGSCLLGNLLRRKENMKIQSLKCWLSLFVVAISLGLIQINRASGQCAISFTGPAGNVLTSSILAYPNYPNETNLFSVYVNDNSQPIPFGTYLGWCVDANTEINPQLVTGPGT